MTLTLGLARTAKAMATTCTITVIGPEPSSLIESGMSRVAQLERLWSRFRPDSDISRVNIADGKPVAVSPETQLLVSFMKAAHTTTHGAFNPTLLPTQIAAGDDTSLDGHQIPARSDSAVAWDTLDQLQILNDGTARVPSSMTLDPGGIGKGLAADIVASEIVAAGADAACVNIGGDLRIVRRPSCTQSWPVTIGSPHDLALDDEVLTLLEGAVATSDRAARRRHSGAVTSHHFSIVGAASDIAGATVIASSAAWAEAWTKHAMTRPVDDTLDMLANLGLAGRIVTSDGTVHRTASWEEFTS